MIPAPLAKLDLPIELFRLRPPFTPLKRFDPSLTAVKTNSMTFAMDVEGRKIALKILRTPGPRTQKSLPPLILLHGMGLHIASFRRLAEFLLVSMDIILPDYNSFADNGGWPPGGVSVPLMARTIARLTESLGFPQVNIGGSSLGGGLSLLTAMIRPNLFQRIVLFNPAIFPQPLPSFYRLVSMPIIGEIMMSITPADRLVTGVTTVGYVNPAKADPELFDTYWQNMARRSNRMKLMDVIRHLPRHEADIRRYLRFAHQLQGPALVIWGEQDRLLEGNAGQRLAAILPRGKYVGIPDLSHLPHEESPETIAGIVLEFLTQSQ